MVTVGPSVGRTRASAPKRHLCIVPFFTGNAVSKLCILRQVVSAAPYSSLRAKRSNPEATSAEPAASGLLRRAGAPRNDDPFFRYSFRLSLSTCRVVSGRDFRRRATLPSERMKNVTRSPDLKRRYSRISNGIVIRPLVVTSDSVFIPVILLVGSTILLSLGRMYQRHVFDFGTAVLAIIQHTVSSSPLLPGRKRFAPGNHKSGRPGTWSRKSEICAAGMVPRYSPKWGLSVALTTGDIFFGCFFRARASGSLNARSNDVRTLPDQFSVVPFLSGSSASKPCIHEGLEPTQIWKLGGMASGSSSEAAVTSMLLPASLR